MKNLFYILIGVLVLGSMSCKKQEPSTETAKTMNDLVVPDNFDWATTKTIPMYINLPVDYNGQLVRVTTIDETQQFFAGYANTGTSIQTSVTIPTSVTTVKLIYGLDRTWLPIAVGAENAINFDYNSFKSELVACDLSGFQSYSQGGWGQTRGPVGHLRDEHFEDVFPDGLRVGTTTGYSLYFSSSEHLNDYLPGGGPSEVLTHSYNNPEDNEGGNWAGQIAAAMCNVYYDAGGYLGENDLDMGDLVFASGPFEGVAVFDFLDLANQAIAGDGMNGHTIEEYAAAAEGICLNFEEGSNGLLTCPDGGGSGDECGCDEGLYALTMRYDGEGTVRVKVKENHHNVTIFNQWVESGESFTFNGSACNGEMDETIKFYINYDYQFSMTTDCSVDLQIGDVYGDFTIMAGVSNDNLPLCGESGGGGGGGGGGNTTTSLDGCLAFEDLWPSKGDYDFNDLVIDYDFNVTKNEADQVLDITAVFTLYATGAYFHNGFGFEFPNVNPDQVISVTGSSLGASTYVTLAESGLEANQSKATVIVYDDSYRIFPHPGGGGIGVNTEEDAPYVDSVQVTIQMSFFDGDNFASGGPVSYEDLDIGNFNPFIIVDQNRDVEVHLSDFAPTSLADQALLGTMDDNSIPAQARYYKTSTNLPWALNIPVIFDYPIEKVEVTSAYLHFAEWAESGGVMYPDWYEDQIDYRNEDLIYTKPANQ